MGDSEALSAEEREASYLNGLMRWRLCFQDQFRRLEDRAAEFRGAVASIPPALAPVGSRLEANWTLTQQWRLRYEVHFFLIAVQNAVRFSEGLRDLRDDADVAAAIQSFKKAQPNADLLRNVHEHVDDYMAGRGRQRSRFPSSPGEGSIDVQPEDVVYEIGGIRFSIKEISDAVIDLTERVLRATQRGLYGL